MQLQDLDCFGHAEGPLVHVMQGFSMEQRLGLSELTQFWCETTVIGRKKIFLKVVNLEVYSYR